MSQLLSAVHSEAFVPKGHRHRKFGPIYRRRHHTTRRFLRSTVAGQLHGLAMIGAVLWLAGLLPRAAAAGPEILFGTTVFGVLGVLLFATSALYHFLYDGYRIRRRVANIFERLDRTFIFLFIAGTYTPILFKVLAEPARTRLLVWVWFWAIVGVAMTNFSGLFPRWAQLRGVYVAVCLCMGWSFVACAGEVINVLSSAQLGWLVYGGIAYSIGAVIYTVQRPNPLPEFIGYHELWHGLVLVGFICHSQLIASLT